MRSAKERNQNESRQTSTILRGELVYETDDRVDSIHRHREVVEGIFSLGFGKFLAQENAEDSE